MNSAVGLFLRRLTRRVWFRASLFALGAVTLALAAALIEELLPFTITIDLGQGSVGSLLQILASSMLAVTTFSLTTMVTAYSSATSLATPRATQLLVGDVSSQNALSTFVGAFVYAMVGIIALSTDYYSDQARVILFLGTLLVLIVIVVTLLRWIAFLAEFGRMADVIDRVERAATEAVRSYAETPTSGARRLTGPPDAGTPVPTRRTGYVAHVDVQALDRIASKAGAELVVVAIPGRMADAATPLVRVRAGELDDAAREQVRDAFTVEHHRTYEHDPRLGVIALAEIGSRALSPATNDPGTAIQVIGALQRVLETLLTTPADEEVRHSHVWMAPVELSDFLIDGVRSLARDGAALLEVQVRLHKSLAALAHAAPDRAADLRQAAGAALQRARAALSQPDADELSELVADLWADAATAGSHQS